MRIECITNVYVWPEALFNFFTKIAPHTIFCHMTAEGYVQFLLELCAF